MNVAVFKLVNYIKTLDGITDKEVLAARVQQEFKLIRDRSVYYCEFFAIRFSSTKSESFSNTVISLSQLQKYDELPFLVCQVSPSKNTVYLANSSFLRKVSHSSHTLRIDNIRGSINGSDIIRRFSGLDNVSSNFEELFNIHAGIGFNENLPRLVEATNSISPSGSKFGVSDYDAMMINGAPDRAREFVRSSEFSVLMADLDDRVNRVRNEIVIASFIENRNIRGRIIEFLITGDDTVAHDRLLADLREGKRIPKFRLSNDLGDYRRKFSLYDTATDIKTKIMVLNSNPKGYNIDKLLEFLSIDGSVFLLYFIGIEDKRIGNQALVSMFQADLLRATLVLGHWAGRNSRGVTQFRGSILNKVISYPNNVIDIHASRRFLRSLIAL